MQQLNSTQIRRYLSNHNITKSRFIGVFPRDRLPLRTIYPSCLVLNTHEAHQPGEHWLAIYYDKDGFADFFDSFGLPPSHYKLEPYLIKTSTSWQHNSLALQSFSNYCGYFCILFILFRCKKYTMSHFLDKFCNPLTNDLAVQHLIEKGYFGCL